MFQGQVIRQAAVLEHAHEIAGPAALARGVAIGLPLSLTLWAAMALLIF